MRNESLHFIGRQQTPPEIIQNHKYYYSCSLVEVDVIRFSPHLHLRVLDEANKTSVIINPHLQISSHLIRKFIQKT